MAVKITFRDNLPPVMKGQSRIRPANAQPENEKVKEILTELDDLIGLGTVKNLIYELQAFIEIQKCREKLNLTSEPTVLHMIFSGNPGTGKTTVARIVGKLFKEIGVLNKGHILECERADLVGEYIGHTAQKTREQIKKALGGILFVDEAYSLARGGEKDFGKEAIDAMVKAMEDQKNNLVIILAGYKNEMDFFIESNPGLRSRFPIHIFFPDYSAEELYAIGESMLSKRQYELSPEAKITFKKRCNTQILCILIPGMPVWSEILLKRPFGNKLSGCIKKPNLPEKI